MASVRSRLRGREVQRTPEYFTFNGQQFPLTMFPTTSMNGSPVEASMANFSAAVRTIHSSSGPVAAAISARSLVISQLEFKFRPYGRDGRLFGSPALLPLEQPGPDLTRQGLLSRIEPDIAYAGNAYIRILRDGRLRRLRPDWVQLIIGSDERPEDVRLGADAEVIGYIYKPGGPNSSSPGQMLGLREVAHWAPEPHPLSNFIGEAWVSAVWREIAADMQATSHVSKFFENAATANMVVKSPPEVQTPDQFKEWVEAFDGAHRGSANAWRSVFVQSGADVAVVGSQIGDLKMSDLQGGFETRVSARSRVPATVLLIREGLGGSALNAGNYQQTRRLWADSWFSPYAQGLCACLSRLVDVPAGSELTYDPSKIMLLQEDQQDAATIRESDARTIQALTTAGFGPDAVIEFVRNNGDLSQLLGAHSGLFSVQLQEPGASTAPAARSLVVQRDDSGALVGISEVSGAD